MKLSLFLRAIRAAAFIVAAGFAAVTARRYLISRWDLAISRLLYGVLGLAFVWIVTWLSTRQLLQELRRGDEIVRPEVAVHQPRLDHGRAQTVHKYPGRLTYSVAALGLFFVALPYFSREPGNAIAPATYVACFGLACIVLGIYLYTSTYSVTIGPDKILVNGFVRREIAFSDVAGTELVKTKNGQQIVVVLKDGTTIRFGRMLTDFSIMSETLSHWPRTEQTK
ncbi:MAG: hypothetical protein E6K36_16240 [Gammaproteobacteria bacterium]|nr:MAG: hypothetical protein E6K36_16240 [Gammaproteobacteria bacterium]